MDKVHKGIGDNLSIMIQWIATFIAALAVGLYRQWQLALFLCAIVPFMAIAAAIFARVSNYVLWIGIILLLEGTRLHAPTVEGNESVNDVIEAQ